MADAFPTLAKTTTSTTGTAAAYVLDTAVLTTAHQTPKQAVAKGSLSDGDIVCYEVRDETVTGDASFERGVGVYTDATNQISRLAANVKDGSNGPGVLVSWPGSGTRTVVLLSVNPEDVAKINRGNTFTVAQAIVLDGTPFSPFANTGLIVQNTASTSDGSIITVMGGTAGSSQIAFGDTDNEFVARILYSHTPDQMTFRTGGADRAWLDVTGLGIGATPSTNLSVQENNTDTTPAVEIEQLSTGDAGLMFSIVGDCFAVGIDNSDSDKFKISYAAGAGTAVLGTNDLFSLDSLGNLGINISNPDGTLHVHKASAGTVTAQAGSVLVLESNALTAISFLSPNTADNFIYFGDVDDNDAGSISYSHITNRISFVAGTTSIASITSNGLRLGSTGASVELLTLDCATEQLEIVDAGSTGATEQDWIEVQVGDVVGYIRVFATK